MDGDRALRDTLVALREFQEQLRVQACGMCEESDFDGHFELCISREGRFECNYAQVHAAVCYKDSKHAKFENSIEKEAFNLNTFVEFSNVTGAKPHAHGILVYLDRNNEFTPCKFASGRLIVQSLE
jgi:hypothetical protein